MQLLPTQNKQIKRLQKRFRPENTEVSSCNRPKDEAPKRSTSCEYTTVRSSSFHTSPSTLRTLPLTFSLSVREGRAQLFSHGKSKLELPREMIIYYQDMTWLFIGAPAPESGVGFRRRFKELKVPEKESSLQTTKKQRESDSTLTETEN